MQERAHRWDPDATYPCDLPALFTPKAALLSSLIALTLLLASGLMSTSSAAPLDAPQCQQQMVSVKLSSLSLSQYHVAT